MEPTGTRTRRETLLGFQPPAIGPEEIEAVVETLQTGWIATGPRAGELERRFAEYVGAKHAVTLASGTAALHLALLAADIGPGDEVITTPITWPATANVVVHCGATPVFVDVKADDLNIDPSLIEAAITPRTKAIIPVHLAGQPAELDEILSFGVPMLEDATHAVESVYRGRKIGSIEGSMAAAFSLNATKNVAGAEGGILTTDDDNLAAEINELRLMRRTAGALYDIRVAGFKVNLPDLLAALALVQLDKVDQHQEIRLRHVAAYDAACAELPGIAPIFRDPRDVHAHHIYVVRIDSELAGGDRNAYREALLAENIATSIHFLPLHELTFYRELIPDQAPLPVAEEAGATVLSLPLSPAHSDEDIQDAIAALGRVHAAFTGA